MTTLRTSLPKYFVMSLITTVLTQSCNKLFSNSEKQVVNVCPYSACKGGYFEHSLTNENIKFSLMVNEELKDKESCQSINDTQIENFDLHSSTTIYLSWRDTKEDCLSQTCGNNVTVVFDYIYTACYGFTIYEDHDVVYNNYGRMELTNYNKELLWNEKPIFHYKCISDIRSIYMNITEVLGIISSKSSMIYFEFMNQSDIKNVNKTCAWCHVYHEPLNIKCTNNIDNPDSFQVNCTWTASTGKSPLIECKLDNVVPGNYNVRFIYNDERCRSGKIWADKEEKCVFPSTLTCEKVALVPNYVYNTTIKWQKHVPTVGPHIYVLIGVLVLVTVIILYWKMNKSNYGMLRTLPVSEANVLEISTLKQVKILLLYPRDCEQFMDAMSDFRKVLQAANCEVLDYWDEDIFSAVWSHAESWVNSIIADKTVKLVVVASEIAQRLEQNDLITYRQREHFDGFFLYCIRMLNAHSIEDSYKRIHVVRLRNVQTEERSDGLISLNPLKVHLLPNQLENLLQSIHGVNIEDRVLSLDEIVVLRFESSVEKYSKYRSENPDYVNSILNIVN